MGNFIQCCELRDNKGEDSLRSILSSIKVTEISEMTFVKGLKEKTKDEMIQISEFFDYMDTFWSQKEGMKSIQITLFNKYFSATLGNSSPKEINIYEVSLLFLPLFSLSIEEKRKAFEVTIKSLTYHKLLYKNIREMVTLYYNFHTIFITKIIYYEYKSEGRKKEAEDLKGLLSTVFNEENIHKEINLLMNDFEEDVSKKGILTNGDLEELAKKIPLSVGDLRDYFINKYYSV